MKLSKYIDHTLLKADASLTAIEKLCDEAIDYDFKSVCVNTCNIEFCKKIDMVINIGALKDGDTEYVTDDIAAVSSICTDNDAVLKVIIETCLLSDEEKVKACECILKAGADFVKTSTGFSTSGATFEDVALLRKTVGDKCYVKAAGGVRSREDFDKMIELGADRIGTSSGTKLIQKGE